ncbi:MAG: hydrocarbon degradation protein [Methylocystis sp.]
MNNPLGRHSFLYFALVALSGSSQSLAAEGIELVGYGARQKALSGSDIADSRDALALSLNPAGIVGLDPQFQFDFAGIFADRGYEATGPVVVVAPGWAQSGQPAFPVANGGAIHPIDAESAWGWVFFGNGGVNTTYGFNSYKPAIYAPNVALPTPPFPPGMVLAGPLIAPSFGGPFGDGYAGIDLRQEFVSLDYARRFGPLTVGVAPTVAVQILNLQGLQTLAPYSGDPYHLSNNGYDWSFGGGLRLGLEYSILPNLRFGLSAATPMFMTPFGKYAGAVADHGRMDVPANISAGLAFDATPDLTLMGGWKHIFYHAVPALGNSSFPLYYGQLGSFGGPGFGWRDTDMASFGVEWRALKPLTLRLGYGYSTAMIGSQDVTLNVLAPAITHHNLNGGFKFEIDKNNSIDFSTVYALKNTLSGPEAQPYASFAYGLPFGLGSVPVTVPPVFNPCTKITAWLSVVEISLSWTYKFTTANATPIAAEY